MRFYKLFEPFRIGQLELKNRIVMPAMDTNFGTDEGYVNDRIKNYCEERAKGGVGLLVPEVFCVNLAQSRVSSRQVSLDDDKYIPAISELVEAVHRHGAKIACQIGHIGPGSDSALTGYQPVAPSAIPRPEEGFEMPRELSVPEIVEIIGFHAKAAERAKNAGFDAVEIHAAHRYLLNAFLSPAWNKRQDEYGGSQENRIKLLLEILKATKDALGEDFPVWCRINGCEYGVEDGITIEMAKQTARLLERAGAAAVHVSAFPASPVNVKAGCFTHLASAIKEAVGIPVIAVGRITPKTGERILRRNQADLIAFGRALIADPELPNKVAAGRLKDIIPCMDCNNCRSARRACTVNATWGKERRYQIQKTDKAKKVLVVGGGPSGMEAARVAALRGHQVTLYDRESRLGGKLLLGGLISDRLEELRRYHVNQMKETGVRVMLGRDVIPALVEELKPDVIIVAAGGKPVSPDIPGIDRSHVLTAADFDAMMKGRFKPGRMSRHRIVWFLGSILLKSPFGVTLSRWVIRFWVPFARSVVVVGGSLAGLEVADFLVKRGKKVTIVEPQDRVEGSEDIMTELTKDYMRRLTKDGVTMLAGIQCKEITRKGIVITDRNGREQLVEAGNIVIADGTAATSSPNVELVEALKGLAGVYTVGDCTGVVGILQGNLDAAKIAHSL